MSVSLSLFAGAGAQFLDNSGKVLTGGLVYTYAAGTTTPQATYTTSSGGTPHTNPIVLDSSGRVPGGEIWLTNGLSYKFVTKTSAGVTIQTLDNILSSLTISASNGSSLVGFIQSGANAVALTVQDKLRDFYTPADCGVFNDPTLTTDQSATIQKWFDDCVSTGKAPFVPNPITVRIDSAVTYDPTNATNKPTFVDIRNLTLKSTFDGGLIIGSKLRALIGMEIHLPSINRSGSVTWLTDSSTSQLSSNAGVIIYNAARCDLYVNSVSGFTVGAAYHSENYMFAYSNIYAARLESNRYNEVLRTVLGAVNPGNEFANENTFWGGYRRENSDVSALGNAYGTVVTAGAGAYSGQNDNRWYGVCYEMSNTAPGATYRVPVYLNGAGYVCKWQDCRHEGGIGPFGIAVGNSSSTVAAVNNFAYVLYQAGGANWRSGWLQVNGAFRNIHQSSDVQTHTWSRGALRNILSSGGTAATPRIEPPFFFCRGTSGTPLRVGATAADFVTNNNALQLGSNVGLFVQIDTSRVKNFGFSNDCLTGFGGRVFVCCFDSSGNRLTGTVTDTWGTEFYAKFNSYQATSTLYGGGYITQSDANGVDVVITFRSEVATAWIGFASGTNPLAINSIDIIAYPTYTLPDSSATGISDVCVTVPTTDESPMRIASAKPDTAGVHGKYSRGEFVGNTSAAAGVTMGWSASASGWLASAWLASTAYAVTGQCVTNDGGKIYALVTGGTSASAGGPTGTGTSITDNTCVWTYIGTLVTFATGPNLT